MLFRILLCDVQGDVLERTRLIQTRRLALLTGCQRGIVMAMALAEAGSDIVGASTSLERNGSDIDREVSARGRKFSAYRCHFDDQFWDRVVEVNLNSQFILSRVIGRDMVKRGSGTIILSVRC
jgi:2-deoxy-D-gluconate 3-dehydrogenase